MKKVQSFLGKRLGQVEGLHHYVMLSGVPAGSVFDPSATTMTTVRYQRDAVALCVNSTLTTLSNCASLKFQMPLISINFNCTTLAMCASDAQSLQTYT